MVSGGFLCSLYSWFKNIPYFIFFLFSCLLDIFKWVFKRLSNPTSDIEFHHTLSHLSSWQFYFYSCSGQNLNVILDSLFPLYLTQSVMELCCPAFKIDPEYDPFLHWPSLLT